ncbi:MAG: hypothetical protein ABWZ40_12700 [Caulobacterales bacterium]
MRFALVFVAASGLLAAPFPSLAKSMSDGRYLRAERCLAYSALSQLQGEGAPDVSLLTEIVGKEKKGRMAPVPQVAKQEAEDIKRAGARANDAAEIERLRAKQTETCAGLVPVKP